MVKGVEAVVFVATVIKTVTETAVKSMDHPTIAATAAARRKMLSSRTLTSVATFLKFRTNQM